MKKTSQSGFRPWENHTTALAGEGDPPFWWLAPPPFPRKRRHYGIGDRDRGSGSPAGQQSSGVGQPTIGRPFYVQAKGQLRLTWRPSAGSPHSEGSRYTPIVDHLLINTSRRGGCIPGGACGRWPQRGVWPCTVARAKGCAPQGKRLTMICASLALLQIMFAVHR